MKARNSRLLLFLFLIIGCSNSLENDKVKNNEKHLKSVFSKCYPSDLIIDPDDINYEETDSFYLVKLNTENRFRSIYLKNDVKECSGINITYNDEADLTKITETIYGCYDTLKTFQELKLVWIENDSIFVEYFDEQQKKHFQNKIRKQ